MPPRVVCVEMAYDHVVHDHRRSPRTQSRLGWKEQHDETNYANRGITDETQSGENAASGVHVEGDQGPVTRP